MFTLKAPAHYSCVLNEQCRENELKQTINDTLQKAINVIAEALNEMLF